MKKKIIKKITLKCGRFYLRRDSDGAGDSGPRLQSINPKTFRAKGDYGDIYVGCCILCGSQTARSFCAQDYWITTPVLEILSYDDKCVKFRTKNSTYTLNGE